MVLLLEHMLLSDACRDFELMVTVLCVAAIRLGRSLWTTGPDVPFSVTTIRLAVWALPVLAGMGEWCLEVLGLLSLTMLSIVVYMARRLLLMNLDGVCSGSRFIFLLSVRRSLLM